LAAALLAYRQSLEIADQLHQRDSSDMIARNDQASAHSDLGRVYYMLDESEPSLAEFKLAYDIMAPLAAIDIENNDAQFDVAYVSRRIGDTSKNLGKIDEARAAYTISLNIYLRLVDQDPADVAIQLQTGWSYIGLGDVEMELGDKATAEQIASSRINFEAALAIFTRMDETDGAGTDAQRSLAYALERVAAVDMKQGKTDDALARLNRSLKMVEDLLKATPDDAELIGDREWVLERLAEAKSSG
jgi:tetratricopeptide (TPR) repeat protein